MSLMSVLACISEAAGRGPGEVHMLKQMLVFRDLVGLQASWLRLCCLTWQNCTSCLHSMGVLMRDHVQW